MTGRKSIDRLLRGVGEDLRDYRVLKALLEDQFDVALHHDPVRMGESGQRIDALVDRLETRRRERVELVEHLLGSGARMAAVAALLADPHKTTLEAGWQALETLVRQCKELNARNCGLMTEQQTIMQRVLFGEAQTYAPA